ncbi:MAG: hypothetical protein SAL70_29660 [Scytonema sp. PMC 1070.18]|nr:hypothetical protein [Scytonema sp. PMC 1070.18]
MMKMFIQYCDDLSIAEVPETRYLQDTGFLLHRFFRQVLDV